MIDPMMLPLAAAVGDTPAAAAKPAAGDAGPGFGQTLAELLHAEVARAARVGGAAARAAQVGGAPPTDAPAAPMDLATALFAPAGGADAELADAEAAGQLLADVADLAASATTAPAVLGAIEEAGLEALLAQVDEDTPLAVGATLAELQLLAEGDQARGREVAVLAQAGREVREAIAAFVAAAGTVAPTPEADASTTPPTDGSDAPELAPMIRTPGEDGPILDAGAAPGGQPSPDSGEALDPGSADLAGTAAPDSLVGGGESSPDAIAPSASATAPVVTADDRAGAGAGTPVPAEASSASQPIGVTPTEGSGPAEALTGAPASTAVPADQGATSVADVASVTPTTEATPSTTPPDVAAPFVDAATPFAAPAAAPAAVSSSGGRGLHVGSAIVQRIVEAVEQLRNAPPPRQVTIELPDANGLRLTIAMRGDGVHVVARGDLAADLGDLGQQLGESLRQRGMDLGSFAEDRGARPELGSDDEEPGGSATRGQHGRDVAAATPAGERSRGGLTRTDDGALRL